MVDSNSNNHQDDFNEALRQFLDVHMRGEKPDINGLVNKFPEFEDQIRQKVHSFQKINSLFDTIMQTDENEFRTTESGLDLVGQKIRSFEIVEIIGRGGMGVVYLAHDTKLDRSVAIKSMPSELQANSTARTRFTREAKLLASLSHPNIGVIYDIIEQTEGSAYLVLEYIPGQTLAERIAKEPLKLEDVLTIALQIAEAVATAHEHDVIHRDLKPGNIKITSDGRVKVLDFGLAKALGSEPTEEPATVTQTGRVIGTPAYMSPEQARGQATDKRSDIWAFGCVLYQMLTGHLPFEGETATDTLVHIIERQPDWELLPQDTPTNIRTLLRRCLEKDQRRRLQHMGDVVIELEETLSLPAVAPPVTTTTIERMRPVSLRRLIVWAVVCLLVGAIAASLITWNLKRPASLSQVASRFIIHPETDLATDASFHHILALSPDGRRLAYVEAGSDARRRIYLRELDEFKARPLPGTEGAVSPFFSPDGQWVGYADMHQRKLKKVSLRGGKPMSLCDSIQFCGGSWGTDDTIIFTPGLGSLRGGGLWRTSASGEGSEQLTVADPNQGERGHLWPQVLPGGNAVLFTNRCAEESYIEVYSLETGQRTKLNIRGRYARYVPTGYIIYAREKILYAVRFDIERLKVVGSSVPIVPSVMTGGSMSAHFAISRVGAQLAYIPAEMRSTELTPVWVDRNGRVETLPAVTPRNYYSVTISPEGRQVAFGISDGENTDVWIYDLTRHTLIPLTSDGNSHYPIWTPDGKWVVFQSYQDGKFQLFRQNVTDSGEPELLAAFEGILARPSCCSPDGKEVLVTRWDYDPNNPRWDNYICVVLLEQNKEYHVRPFIRRKHVQRQGVWSPDGGWVAYASDESGRWEIYVEPYPCPGPKTVISTTGGYQPAWSRDGKELFYRSGRGNRKMMAATFETEPDFRVTSSEELFEGQYQRHIQWRNYDVAPDGRFLIIQEPQEPPPLGINVVLNWFEELKRRVPHGKE